MFWRNIYTPSRVDTLLENENVTLQELMDEDDIVQECKSSNKKLVDFLARPEIVEVLLKLVLDEPLSDTDDKMRFKYSNIACELISSDINQITDILVTTESLVLPLFAFLKRPDPLNPLQASFFSKIMGLLISRKSETMLDLIKSHDGFIENVLRHLGTSAIMDLLLRLITCIDSVECRTNCINWLSKQKLVEHLILLIDASETPERNTNAAQTLCDIVRLGKDTMSNFQDGPSSDALLLEVEKSESLSLLLDHMFKDTPTESVVVNGLYVLQALMEPRRTSDVMQEQSASSDVEHLHAVVNDMYEALAPHLKDFHHLLTNPPKQHYAPMATTLGSVTQPVGLTRLQVACLISSLVAAHNVAINQELTSLRTVGCLLDLFFQYPWNNFLHTQVERCLTTVVNSTLPDNPLLIQLVKEFDLLGRITNTFNENREQQSLPGKQRLGHLGHLTRVANHIASKLAMGADSHLLARLFEELPDETQQGWKTFVGGLLSDTNQANAVELGGMNSGSRRIPSSSEDDDDIGYLNFQMDDNLQKAFTDYQSQQMTSNFADQFGFSEEECAEQDESIGSSFMSKISSIDFELNMIEDNPTAAAMFEQACNDRIRQFDNAESDEEWELKEMSSFSQISENHHSTAIRLDDNRRTSSKHDSYEDEEEGFVVEDMEDSEESTDSEDDLSSPRLIRQTFENEDMKRQEELDAKTLSDANKINSLNHEISNLLEDSSDKIEKSHSVKGKIHVNDAASTIEKDVPSSTDSDIPIPDVGNGIDIDDINVQVENVGSGSCGVVLEDGSCVDPEATQPKVDSS